MRFAGSLRTLCPARFVDHDMDKRTGKCRACSAFIPTEPVFTVGQRELLRSLRAEYRQRRSQ